MLQGFRVSDIQAIFLLTIINYYKRRIKFKLIYTEAAFDATDVPKLFLP